MWAEDVSKKQRSSLALKPTHSIRSATGLPVSTAQRRQASCGKVSNVRRVHLPRPAAPSASPTALPGQAIPARTRGDSGSRLPAARQARLRQHTAEHDKDELSQSSAFYASRSSFPCLSPPLPTHLSLPVRCLQRDDCSRSQLHS
jgi:hypothetical protein